MGAPIAVPRRLWRFLPLRFLLCGVLLLAAFSALRHRWRDGWRGAKANAAVDFTYDVGGNPPLGLSTRELLLAERVRDVEGRNVMLKRQLSISQKQLMSYASVSGSNKKVNPLVDEEEDDAVADDDEEGGGGAGGSANEDLEEAETGVRAAKDGSKPCGDPGLLLPKCEVIHVGLVCAGVNATRSAATLVKSVLFYRKHPVHFHFVVDDVAGIILKELFRTWDIKQLTVSFYNATTIEDDVSWIPNKHYSGIYGLLKLTLPKVLPKTLPKIIVLDTDITLASDISNLWKLFRTFSPDAALGLVENQSDWYIPGKLWKSHQPWPALGRGFNTGVILMHLERLRQNKWHQLWRLVAEKDLLTMFTTHLADQDVFNAVLKQQPTLLERLPCQWNLQLSDHTRAELCYASSSVKDLGAVHFNSPRKLNAGRGLKNFEFFRGHFLTFQQYDGGLLRRDLVLGCDEDEQEPLKDSEDESNVLDDEGCYELRRAGKTTYRTHLYFLDFDLPEEEVGPSDVTLVAQLSMDRLHMIELLSERWSGPMSLALYLSDAEAQQLVDFVQGSEVLQARKNIGYHVVYKDGGLFPVNALRNVALSNVRTPFVFLSDADFLPGGAADVSAAFARAAGQLLLRTPQSQETKKLALVVPALETYRYRLQQFPRSKAEAVELLDLGTLLTFRYHVWPRGHQATNFGKWRVATKPYRIKWEQDFEPYVIVPSSVAPRYDPRFAGFGWNKVSHVMELDAAGFDFAVLPNVFAIHMPHAPSLDIAKFRASNQYRKCLKDLKQEFVQELNQRYSKNYSIN